ncbi:HalOD1 output domain-containing protein [Natronorarus salvus]|uniref:HalOD1 output domain-containing protein n=1 Tax=Natronorarus salvus TaxID=3117733 RepID=UPI002F26B702
MEPGSVEREVGSEDICAVVVDAVADAKGVHPLDLEPKLYDVIEPDALVDLWSSSDSPPRSMRIGFSMAGCDVVVRGDGRVVVTPGEPTPDPTGASVGE